jgi:glycosyltransferase involved in cell wall biosynthesis
MDAIVRAPGRLHVLELLGNAIVGGMETSVIRLARELPSESFRVSALCPFESSVTESLRDAGADVLIAPVRDDPVWQTLQMIATFVIDEHVDVMHAHLSNAHVLGALVSGLTERPCVATIHGRAVPMLDLEAHRLCDTMHMNVVCRPAYGHARMLGVPRQRLHLIGNGVPIDDMRAASGSLAATLGLAPHAPIVGFVGRLSPEKGPDVFLRAAWLVAHARNDAAFVVVGDGPLRAELERTATDLGIAERTHFLGERHDVAELLRSFAMLVVSSHAEGMPLALMEAMAAGLPVVATSVGGVPELIEHERTGLLAAPGDAAQLAAHVEALLADPARRMALGSRGRSRASALWPQRAAALRIGRMLKDIAGPSDEPRVRSAAPARVRLAGRVAARPGSR